MKTPKKLIEVALPLDDINVAAAKEKSIRHGHPSTLHLWWARRPLAAARAVLFAQMVNDPGGERGWTSTKTKAQAAQEREKLFDIIRDLVKWENTNNEVVLSRAKAAIKKSWQETCDLNKGKPGFNSEELPVFHDPFAGGGTIPLEAKRLGFLSYASDLNPIPILLNRCMLEIVGRFGITEAISKQEDGLFAKDEASAIAADLKYYATRILEESKKVLVDNYPKIQMPNELGGGKRKVLTWIWCRTVSSPNPMAKGKHSPLLKTRFLSNKKGRYIWIDPIVNDVGDLTFHIRRTESKPTLKGTIGRSGATCIYTDSTIPLSYIREQGKIGKIKHRLVAAIVLYQKKKLYISGDEITVPDIKAPIDIPRNEILHWSGCTNVCVYGMTKFKDLFSPRQQVAMYTFAKCIHEIHDEIVQDSIEFGLKKDNKTLVSGGSGAFAYADAICLFLACCLGRAADYWNSVTSWESTGEFVAHAFTKHALPMIWDYGEINPIGGGGGSWESAIGWVVRVIKNLPQGKGFVLQHNAMEPSKINNAVISTDPPYYDNVPYSNLSDFFYMWTRIALKGYFPDNFQTIQTPKKDELIASHSLHDNIDDAMKFFSEGMTRALTCINAETNPAVPITLYYAFKQSDTSEAGTSSTGWESFLESVIKSGFSITGTWPIRTERASRGRAIGSNALASSVVLVCRKRKKSADEVSRRQFQRELREKMPDALEAMLGGEEGISPIAPVDLSQSAIGPGMAIFSKYEGVLNQDGKKMSVHDAMILINRAITEYLNPDSGNFDADTLFCDDWFGQYGWGEGQFGEANVLAQAKGTTVDGVVDAGVLVSGGGKVRLLKWSEYPSDWDPKTDKRTPIWEACHQIIRVLNQQSETQAGTLLAMMPERGEAIRQLAYHLYTQCERKKWAEEARAYNELIGSWHAIVSASQDVDVHDEQQREFDF